jgi:hypothetical protein
MSNTEHGAPDEATEATVADYNFQADGSVKVGSSGTYVAFFDSDGTVRDSRGGRVLGHVADDGTVRQGGRSGSVLGVVASDGTVRQGNRSGPVAGRVGPPVHKSGALLLLLG